VPIDTLYQDTIVKADIVYGISNEISIPRRQTDVSSIQEPIEKLFDPSPIIEEVANWQIFILVVAVLLMGFVRAFSNNRFNQGIKALFNYSVAQEITREEKVFFHRSNVLFTIVHLLTLSLFVFQLREAFRLENIDVNKFSFFLLILTFLGTMYFIKYIFSRILLFVFNDASIASEYIFNVSLYNNLLGSTLAPVLCITYFTSVSFQTVLLYLAIPLMLIIFIFRLFRMVNVGEIKGVSYLYIFVYICTLEILPLVVLFRIFIFK
tara:strand:+ start:2603 stop:3397 length:795 start_codon:yes stop_codon:yes gene_type:complete